MVKESRFAFKNQVSCNQIFTKIITYSFWVFGLPKYFQKIVIREKVEARENLPLRFQIHVKWLLNLIQF